MSYAPNPGTITAILPGMPVQVVSGLTAANFVANQASQANLFSVQSRADGGDRVITFKPSSDGTLTTLTANLESSDDGGVTWSTYPNGATLTFSALAQVQVLHLVGGLLYRLNTATFALGTGTTVTVDATVS